MTGWSVPVIRECALSGPERQDGTHVLDNAAIFILAASQALLEIAAVQAGSGRRH